MWRRLVTTEVKIVCVLIIFFNNSVITSSVIPHPKGKVFTDIDYSGPPVLKKGSKDSTDFIVSENNLFVRLVKNAGVFLDFAYVTVNDDGKLKVCYDYKPLIE